MHARRPQKGSIWIMKDEKMALDDTAEVWYVRSKKEDGVSSHPDHIFLSPRERYGARILICIKDNEGMVFAPSPYFLPVLKLDKTNASRPLSEIDLLIISKQPSVPGWRLRRGWRGCVTSVLTSI